MNINDIKENNNDNNNNKKNNCETKDEKKMELKDINSDF